MVERFSAQMKVFSRALLPYHWVWIIGPNYIGLVGQKCGINKAFPSLHSLYSSFNMLPFLLELSLLKISRQSSLKFYQNWLTKKLHQTRCMYVSSANFERSGLPSCQVNESNASRMETPIKMAENLNETGLTLLHVRRI